MPAAAALIENAGFYAIYFNSGLEEVLEAQNKIMPKATDIFLYLLIIYLSAALDRLEDGLSWDAKPALAGEIMVFQAYTRFAVEEKQSLAEPLPATRRDKRISK